LLVGNILVLGPPSILLLIKMTVFIWLCLLL